MSSLANTDSLSVFVATQAAYQLIYESDDDLPSEEKICGDEFN